MPRATSATHDRPRAASTASRATTRARALAFPLALALGAACALASCGLFELGEVVAIGDAGAADARDGGGGAGDACVPDGDPCGCLPEPLTVSPGPNGAGEAIVVADGNVYFMSSSVGGGGSDRAIFRAPTTGTDGRAPTRVMVPSPSSPPLVAAGSSLFFRRIGTGLSVLRVAKSATDATPTVHAGPLPLVPVDVVASTDDVYWSNGNGAICVAQVDGGQGPPDPADSGCLTQPFVAPRDGGATGAQLALSPVDMFWSTGSRVWRTPLDDGTASMVVATQPGASVTVAGAEAARVFWVSIGADAGALWSAVADGGGASELVPSLVDTRVVPSIVVDSDGVFWGQRNYAYVMGADLDGSNVRVVACEPGVPALATDADHVYWLTTNGAVRRAPKR